MIVDIQRFAKIDFCEKQLKQLKQWCFFLKKLCFSQKNGMILPEKWDLRHSARGCIPDMVEDVGRGVRWAGIL